MNIHKTCPKLLELRDRHGSIVDERPATSRCRHLAAHNALGVIVKVVLLEPPLQSKTGDIEATLNNTTVGTFADRFCIGTLPQQHGDCTKKDRLTVSGLTRNDRKACGEIDLHTLNECKITYRYMFKHYAS